jgi:murein DD-endopeptidase MepM/ murein hydrolase activator NlpD
MKRKRHTTTVSILVLIVAVLSLSIVLAQPVNAGGGVVLRPPFNGTYRVTAYFDHDRPNYDIGADGYIWIYNGERVTSSFPNKTGEPYPYDGHDGWDFSMGIGTDVLAAAAGQVVLSTDSWQNNAGFGTVIVIAHENNYYTLYAHLSARLVEAGTPVVTGQHIAESGNTGTATTGAHLHFGLRHGGYNSVSYAIDPFGWRGTQRDPLFNYNSKESSCLWAGAPGANISCADFIVEDDGAGWSQDPASDNACSASNTSWARCDAGNGFRYHWTNVVNPPDYWAKWTPTLPHRGYYQIHAFIPAQNATTTNARYEIHRLGGTTIVPINQNNIFDDWASLGTFYLQSPTEYVQLYDDTDEPSFSKKIAADSVKFSASIVHLPYVRNTGGWVSSIVVRNNSTSPVQFTINYYNTSGGLVTPTTAEIAGNASAILTAPTGHEGSAVVVASQDVAVVVENRSGALGYAYTGQTSPATTLRLPQTLGNPSSVWHTNIRALNTGSSPTNITTNFYNPDGSVPSGGISTLPNVAVNGSGEVIQSLPSSYWGAARMTANQPIAAVVRVSDSSAHRRLGYTGMPVAASTVWLPFVMTRLGNDWGATIWVQNTTGTDSTVSIDFYNEGGWAGSTGASTLKANAMALFNLRTTYYGLGEGWYGSARVTAGVPVAVVVNQLNDRIPTQGASYEGVPASAGSTTVILPRVVRESLPSGCYTSNFTVRNLGSGNATITIYYYNANGTQAATPVSDTVVAHKVYNLKTAPPNGLPNPFYGSVKIVSTNNRSIAATSNLLDSYCGTNDAISYTAVNR